MSIVADRSNKMKHEELAIGFSVTWSLVAFDRAASGKSEDGCQARRPGFQSSRKARNCKLSVVNSAGTEGM